MILLEIFISFIQIGLFSIGGGYAAMPIIENQVLKVHNWLTLEEFADLITISQLTPGPIAINAATFVGTRVAGLPGAIIATIGCIIPSSIILLTLAYCYTKYKNLPAIQGILKGIVPAVVSLIATAGISILLLTVFETNDISVISINDINYVSVIIVAVGVFILRKYKANPIHVMIGTGIIGIIVYGIF